MNNKEDEIDLLELLQKIYNHRKFILKMVAVFGLIGLFIAMFSPKVYTASTTLVPQTASGGKIGGNLGGLAAMAGINLGSSGSENGIPPTLYPKVINSIPFKKELVKTPLKFSDIDEPISFEEYYKNHQKFNLLNAIKKYTIGLPGVIINAIKGENKQKSKNISDDEIYRLTPEEYEIFNVISENISVEVNDKDGYVLLSSSMPEALPAAQLTKKAQQLLQNEVIEFKTQKAQDQLSFIEDRYREKEKEFKKKQSALAGYMDRNKGLSTSRSQTYLERLQAEYNLALNVFTELAKQLETQKIQVKENTPVFAVIDPVSVPVEKSKPKRAMILAVWLFLGLVVGIGTIFGKEWIGNLKKSI